MRYTYTILFGILFGVAMNVLWGLVFSAILGAPGFGVGLLFAVAFACCGCLLGYAIDRKNKDN